MFTLLGQCLVLKKLTIKFYLDRKTKSLIGNFKPNCQVRDWINLRNVHGMKELRLLRGLEVVNIDLKALGTEYSTRIQIKDIEDRLIQKLCLPRLTEVKTNLEDHPMDGE